MKLEKINSDLYATPNLEYTMRKEFKIVNRRYNRVWRLYKDGQYVGMPENVKQANEIIKGRR